MGGAAQVWIYKGKRAADEMYRGMWERSMDEMLSRLLFKNEESGYTYVAEFSRHVRCLSRLALREGSLFPTCWSTSVVVRSRKENRDGAFESLHAIWTACLETATSCRAAGDEGWLNVEFETASSCARLHINMSSTMSFDCHNNVPGHNRRCSSTRPAEASHLHQI